MKIAEYIKNNVHNPLSTMTNLSYVLFGYLSLGINPVLGTLLIILGIASSGFHWARTDCWHKADIVAIYYVFSTIAGYLWLEEWGIVPGLLLGAVAHYSFGPLKQKHGSNYSQTIIGIFGLLCIIPFAAQNGFWDTARMLWWFAAAMGVSQIADYFEPEQDGEVYDTFHAIWHIFSAIGIYHLII